MSEHIPEMDDHIQIEPNRRLLNVNTPRIKEFFSTQIGTRIVSLPAGEEDARSHEELTELRLPVFSGLYRDNELWLIVPEGSRSLGKLTRFIARDIPNYAEIFLKLGNVLGQLETASVGFPQLTKDRSVLDSYVFSIEEDEQYGGTIYLAPPYNLNPEKTIGQALGSIAVELENSKLFVNDEIAHLMDVTVEGLTNA